MFRAREATKDIDALLVPAAELRRAAKRIAEREGLPEDWLNDAVKGFFSQAGRFEIYEELSHLRILGLHSVRAAEDILGRYYSLDRYPVKSMYVLQELLESDS